MDLIDDEDPVLAPVGGVVDTLPEAPHILHRVVGRTVNLHHIGSGARPHVLAHGTFETGFRCGTLLAVEAGSQGPRGRGLSHAPGAGEQKRMVDAPHAQRVLKGSLDVVLASDFSECARAPLAGDCLVAHSIL